MRSRFEQVLDTCLGQLKEGHDLEAVLARHPGEADELRPMLVAAALMRLDAPPPRRKVENKAELMTAVAARRREVDAANGIVVEIKAGVPLPEVLSHAAPGQRPLVVAAWRMFSTPPPAPAPETIAAGKARLMALAAARRAESRAPARSLSPRVARGLVGLRRGWLPRPGVARRAWSGSVAAVTALALIVTVAGVGSAAASSLPGDSFYSVKELGRSAQLLFAFDPAKRAEIHLRIAGEQLREMELLGATGRDVPAGLLDQWLARQAAALGAIQALPMDERGVLAQMLLDVLGDESTLEESLRDAVASGTLEELLARSGRLASEARGAAGEERDDRPAADETELPGGAPPAPRPLPDEKVGSRAQPRVPADRERSAGPPDPAAEVVEPVAVEAPAPEDRGSPEAPPQVAQPRNERPSDDEGRSPQPARPPSAGGAGDPAPPTATEEEPAFNQPIFEEPTETPEPPQTAEPEARQPDDPSLPVEPVTPAP